MPNPWIWLRHKLMLNADAAAIQSMRQAQTNLNNEIALLHVAVFELTKAVDTIVNKLGLDELDPVRRAASDRLSADAIRRLEAEAKARKPYG